MIGDSDEHRRAESGDSGSELRVRAWNAGTPPFPDQAPLTPQEVELTDFLTLLQEGNFRGPLLGPDGFLFPRMREHCPLICAAAGEAELNRLSSTLSAREIGHLDESTMERLTRHQIPTQFSSSVAAREALFHVAEELAQGTIGLYAVMGKSKLSVFVIAAWLVGAAARVGAVPAVLERHANTPGLWNVLKRAHTADSQAVAHLISHIYADLIKSERRKYGGTRATRPEHPTDGES